MHKLSAYSLDSKRPYCFKPLVEMPILPGRILWWPDNHPTSSARKRRHLRARGARQQKIIVCLNSYFSHWLRNCHTIRKCHFHMIHYFLEMSLICSLPLLFRSQVFVCDESCRTLKVITGDSWQPMSRYEEVDFHGKQHSERPGKELLNGKTV